MYTCPNCGKDIDTERCECGFDVNDTLSCPYLMSLNCVHTNMECKVTGLNYEDCDIYLHKAGLQW